MEAKNTPYAATPILIVVDDDDTFRGLLTEVLEQLGYEVFAYRDAESLSVPLLVKMRPAMAIVDVMIPGLPGDKLCAMLASACGAFGMKVLLTSNLDEATLARRAREAWADAFVTKRKLLADPARALTDLVPAALVEADLIEDVEVKTPQAALGRAVQAHLSNYQPRVDIRVQSSIPASVSAGSTRFEARLTELSASGGRLLLEETTAGEDTILAVESGVTVAFALAGFGDFQISSRVAWRQAGADGRLRVVGLSFPKLEKAVLGRIDAFLRKAADEHFQRRED
jgi:CheY-like chemotaxis protein